MKKGIDERKGMTRVGGEEARKSESATRDGGKIKENKIYPGHWRDFVSYILFEPIGFIYAGGRGLGRARGCARVAEWRALPVKEFFYLATPPRPFAVRTLRVLYCIFNSLLFISVSFSYVVQV